jgi:preprotein translocase subunit SecA
MKQLISNIKSEYDIVSNLNDEDLKIQIEKLKHKGALKNTSLSDLIVPWFAVVQTVSERTLGLKHFDTQLLAGSILHEGKIVEMKTGEGKTLSSTLPVSLNALSQKGVHVVTVNDYLAERDQRWMGKVYNGLNLSVGLVKSNSNLKEKQKSYNQDITYVTNSELVFDYLRDSSAFNRSEIVQRPFNYCVIDEIDSILIDEARTPLILSAETGDNNINKLYLAKTVADLLQKDVHFQLEEKRREINLTEEGYKKTKEALGKKTLYDSDDPWILEILNALKAKHIFKLNKDYILLNNKICIVDEFTGRIMEDRRWSMGIHEAIETKEKVEIGGGTKTKSAITYQNFFTLYPKLAGMTGTAKTTEKEFQDIYNLEIEVVPTAKKMQRKDLSDFVYQNELAKWKAVLNQTKECYSKGQPILIGTASVEKSEFLSDLFNISKIPHQILNAKPENVRRESEIVAQAGERFSVTIATNMAGRGTDIILGGNPAFKTKQQIQDLILNNISINENLESLKNEIIRDYEENSSFDQLKQHLFNLPYSLEDSISSLNVLYDEFYSKNNEIWRIENEKVKALGGLFVLGTERHETRRIDNQLRGRSGRQGDPGISQFFVSLEDELIKVFGGDSIRRWVEYLVEDKDSPLESGLLTKSLENAQQKVELYNYDLRKNVFQYDDVLNSQRKQIFNARNEILCKNIFQNLFLRYFESLFDEEISNLMKKRDTNSLEMKNKLERLFGTYFTFCITFSNFNVNNSYKELWISYDLRFASTNLYENGLLKNTRATILLSIIDFYWTEHIERMNYIRETISWRSYGQQNPLVEYNTEAFNSFKLMFKQIRASMIYYFINNPII